MFRTRKEDSLFDTTTDTAEIVESATVISAPAQPAATATPAAASSSAYTAPAQSAAAPAAQPQRPIPSQEAARATATPPNAPAFRPNTAAAPQEAPRARVQENKPAAAAVPAAPTERAVRTNQRVLTVGNDILLKGEIATCDRLVIEGKVDATLNDVHTVEIAQNGSFKGSAHIEDAEISGLFEGDLIVRNRLVIYATGKVRGKITYGEIEIERGGELTGEIKTVSQSASTSSRKSEKAAA